MVFEAPDSLLKEFALVLEAQFGVSLTEQRIGQIFKENNINRKVVASSYECSS